MRNGLLAVNAVTIAALEAKFPGVSAVLGQAGVAMSERQLAEVINIQQETDAFIYAGHKPLNGENNYSYFQTITTGESDDTWTNVKSSGKVPFVGTFKITGIGLIIDPMYTLSVTGTDYAADISHSVTGFANLKVGSREGSILKMPLQMLFTQNLNCCTAASSTAQNKEIRLVSTSPFGGKMGFIPLPKAPEIGDNSYFSVEVTYKTAWTANSNVNTYFILFGKQRSPIAE